MRQIIYLLLIITLFACNTSNDNTNIKDFKVSGIIKNVPPNTYISLIHRETNNITTLDSIFMIDSTFELSANITNKIGFYLIKLSSNEYYIYLLADSSDNISITGDFLELQNYKIKNSAESEQIQILENNLFSTNKKIEKLINNGADISEIKKTIEAQKQFSLNFIENQDTSLSAIIALSQKLYTGETILPIEEYYETYKAVNLKLRTKFLNSEYYKQFAEFIKNYEIIQNRENNNHNSNSTPTELINFQAKTLNGDDFELNSLKGEWILINFWASWCATCTVNNKLIKKIAENKPEIKIVQISIDKYEDIAKDSLNNYNFKHILINDTKGWDSELINLYNINVLPTNILINPNGKVVLFSSESEELYDKLFK